MYFKYAKQEEELQEAIEFLAKDLINRKKDISNDWNKAIQKIEIKATIGVGELLQWEVTKTYNAYNEMEDENEISN